MRKTRFFAAGLAALLTAGVLVSAALACGHHGRRAVTGRTVSCQVCTAAGCELTGRHVHNGVTYCGYGHASGLCDGNCHALCTVSGCTEAGPHVHSGVTYCGYGHANGFCDGNCHALCTVSGCTVAGPHVHSGVTYCGYGHADGFCDGSCIQAAASAPANGNGRHHGGRHGHC